MDFRKELESLINKYSKENGSNTPDFILADFLNNCLSAFDTALNERSRWYGRHDIPGRNPERYSEDDHWHWRTMGLSGSD